MNLTLLATAPEQIDSIIQSIKNKIGELLKQQSQIILAVSGGKTPIDLFKKLSNTNLPWDKITITLVDERITDNNIEDSNQYLVKKYLLQNMAKNAKFNALLIAKQSIPQILDHANQWVTQIDIAILGMGEDGHIASIFPECPQFKLAINKHLAPAYICTHPISAKYSRISLNLSAIIKIPYLILNISGTTKLNVLKEAARGCNQNYPISYLIVSRPDINVFFT